jgi:hypothetical protein
VYEEYGADLFDIPYVRGIGIEPDGIVIVIAEFYWIHTNRVKRYRLSVTIEIQGYRYHLSLWSC